MTASSPSPAAPCIYCALEERPIVALAGEVQGKPGVLAWYTESYLCEVCGHAWSRREDYEDEYPKEAHEKD